MTHRTKRWAWGMLPVAATLATTSLGCSDDSVPAAANDAPGVTPETEGPSVAQPEAGPDAAAPAKGTVLPLGERLTQLWDGESGATRDHWNAGLAIPWKRDLGDWKDAKGVSYGTDPFAKVSTTASTSPQKLTFDVTALTREWLSKGNTGALLTGTASVAFASREHANTASRPVLTVTTDKGTFTPACRADSSLNATTFTASGGASEFKVSSGSINAVIQFDLTSVTGVVSRAELVLTANTAAKGTVSVYLLDAPLAWADAGGFVESGISAAYPYDANLAQHAGVLYAHDFSPGYEAFFTENWRNKPAFQEEPFLRSTSVRNYFDEKSTGSSSLAHRWSSRHEEQPDEIYFRYYVFLEDDWGSEVDGNKMPGIAGRYGAWNGRYYEPRCGNGGSPTDGRVHSDGVRCGWTLRGHSVRPEPKDANPYKEFTPLGTYAYHADMPGDFGQVWRWGNHTVGFPVLRRGKWYSIEQYAKVNTVDGPLDSLQNGVGRNDGIFRAWVDGVRVYEKTDIRMRHTPLIKVDDIWLDWYHGGTETPAPGKQHHYRMSNIVVSRNYIGPLTH